MKTLQEICDKWANILKIGSWKFTVQEIDNDYDSIHTQSSDGSAVILLGKHNNTMYDIEKRIVLGFLMVWAKFVMVAQKLFQTSLLM